IRGKYDEPPGSQQARASIYEHRMVPIDVQHALHALRIRECRGIDENEVVTGLPGPGRAVLQPKPAVRLDQSVVARRETIELEVALRPVEISVGHINRQRAGRASGGGIHGSRTGIRKQVEEALPGSRRTQSGTRHTVIEEQPGIEVVIE